MAKDLTFLKHYAYGYLLADNGHLTSFAYGTEEEASTFMSGRATFSKFSNAW